MRRPKGQGRTPSICEQCGKEYLRPARFAQRFCSHPCRHDWLRTGATNWLGTFTCITCGVQFQAARTLKRKNCSKACQFRWQSEHRVGEAGTNFRGGYEPYYGPSWAKARRLTRQRDGNCVDCGITPTTLGRALDVHHIVPFRMFGRSRHLEANALTNLVALCRSCHRKRDILNPHGNQVA